MLTGAVDRTVKWLQSCNVGKVIGKLSQVKQVQKNFCVKLPKISPICCSLIETQIAILDQVCVRRTIFRRWYGTIHVVVIIIVFWKFSFEKPKSVASIQVLCEIQRLTYQLVSDQQPSQDKSSTTILTFCMLLSRHNKEISHVWCFFALYRTILRQIWLTVSPWREATWLVSEDGLSSEFTSHGLHGEYVF